MNIACLLKNRKGFDPDRGNWGWNTWLQRWESRILPTFLHLRNVSELTLLTSTYMHTWGFVWTTESIQAKVLLFIKVPLDRDSVSSESFIPRSFSPALFREQYDELWHLGLSQVTKTPNLHLLSFAFMQIFSTCHWLGIWFFWTCLHACYQFEINHCSDKWSFEQIHRLYQTQMTTNAAAPIFMQPLLGLK